MSRSVEPDRAQVTFRAGCPQVGSSSQECREGPLTGGKRREHTQPTENIAGWLIEVTGILHSTLIEVGVFLIHVVQANPMLAEVT